MAVTGPPSSLSLNAATATERLARDLWARKISLVDYSPQRYLQIFETADRSHGYRYVSPEAQRFCHQVESVAGSEGLGLYHKFVLAKLIETAPGRMQRTSLPASAVDLIETSLARILAQLDVADYSFYRHQNDLFAKDFALCRLKLLPCGAELIEAVPGVPRSVVVRGGIRQAAAALAFFAGRAGGFKRWYESHWDRRLIRSFTPRGYDDCYVRIAELLKLNAEIRGVMTSSWWFDPALDSISPNLSFLRTVPQSAGARLFRVGVNEDATADAVSFSGERARLHAEGRYQPTVYMLVWARADLLEWAARSS